MADDSFLSIDNDWKKQAQEEKRRLAEKAQAEKAQAAKSSPPPATASSSAAPTAGGSPSASRRGPGEREAPAASFATLVQQIMTQALFYLGEIAYRGAPPMTDLDMAKYQIDLLGLLEQKTANNLGEDEQKALDVALHETRSRFIRAATEQITF